MQLPDIESYNVPFLLFQEDAEGISFLIILCGITDKRSENFEDGSKIF